MRSRSFILVAVLLAALLVLVGVVYAYDHGRRDRVAKGVTVSGVDVGGLNRPAARDTLRRALLAPLNRPLTITARGRTWTVTPEDAHVTIDLDGSIDAAIARSRQGNPLSRAVREVTGGTVRVDIPVEINYSHAAVARVVKRVRATLDKAPVDATVDLDHGDLTPQRSKPGRRLQVRRLSTDVAAALVSRSGERTIRAHTSFVRPAVTTEQLGTKYPTVVMVDRSHFTLRLYKKLRLSKTYKIAVGKVGLETPAGLYHIQNKAINPAWHVPDSDWAGKLAGKVIPPGDPQNPIKARWMGIYDGAGIHGTSEDDSIGSAASHGCIRMHISDVEDLYDRVETGAPVYIA